MRQFLRDHGLALFLIGLLLVTFAASGVATWVEYVRNEQAGVHAHHASGDVLGVRGDAGGAELRRRAHGAGDDRAGDEVAAGEVVGREQVVRWLDAIRTGGLSLRTEVPAPRPTGDVAWTYRAGMLWAPGPATPEEQYWNDRLGAGFPS